MGNQYKKRCECAIPVLWGRSKVCSHCGFKVSRKRLKMMAHGSDIIIPERRAAPPHSGSGELHVSP